MNGPRVTVFTTLYNAAEYLPRFFECMSRQSYTEYILLIVDDGSEDSTLEICRAYAERDPRLQIIHTEHRGLAPAKITAIKTGNDEQLKRSIAWFDSKYGDGFILGKLKQTKNEGYDFSGKEAVIEYYQEMLREKDRAARQKTERLNKELAQKEKEIRDLKNSMSFRLGRIMTKPGRTVRDLLKKRSH